MPEIHSPLPVASILSVTTGVNLKSVAASLLYTTPAGKRAVITQIIVHVTVASSFTVAPTISFGQNATNYNDIVTSTVFSGVNALNEVYTLDPNAAYISVPASTGIYANITVGATATTATAEIILIGILV